MLHCGRQKAVDTLRELQYNKLIEIKRQGCGKPNCIYPKVYGRSSEMQLLDVSPADIELVLSEEL